MTTLQQHPHAEFDRFPQLIRDLAEELGSEGIAAIADRFIAAEMADFYWDGRVAETPLGQYFESLEEGEERLERVAILGYFHSRYYVAECLVDGKKRVRWMLGVRHFDDFESAEAAFRAAG
jgi:hypothetical protein